MPVRTRFQDGGGAYLLLDGSRAMKDTLLTKAIHPIANITYDVGWAGGYYEKMFARYFECAARLSFYINPGIITSHNVSGGEIRLVTKWGGEKAVLRAYDGECHIPLAGDITLLANKIVSGLGDVRAPNLPAADPADGLSKLWNNAGVVTVGT